MAAFTFGWRPPIQMRYSAAPGSASAPFTTGTLIPVMIFR